MKKLIFFLLLCFTLLIFHSCTIDCYSSMSLKEADLHILKGEAKGLNPIKLSIDGNSVDVFKTVIYDSTTYSLEVSGDKYVYKEIQPIKEN